MNASAPWNSSRRFALIRCHGAAHDATIDPSTIATIVADRTIKMKDKVLPRIDFMTAQAETLFSVYGLDGLDPFRSRISRA